MWFSTSGLFDRRFLVHPDHRSGGHDSSDAGRDDGGGDGDTGEDDSDETAVEIDASMTMSAEERLRKLDFEQMSTAEMAVAKRMIARLTLPVTPIKSRRGQAAARGARMDWRRTLRRAMRQGGEMRDLARLTPRDRWPNLVVLCDLSGSMSQYSRVVLHFLHAVSNARGAGWAKVHAYTFGTRLTNITRHLRHQPSVSVCERARAHMPWLGAVRGGAGGATAEAPGARALCACWWPARRRGPWH